MSTAVESETVARVERITIPLRKSCKASAAIELLKTDQGWEYGAEWVDTKGQAGETTLTGISDPQPTRLDAIKAAVGIVIDALCGDDKRIVTDCERFIGQFDPDTGEEFPKLHGADETHSKMLALIATKERESFAVTIPEDLKLGASVFIWDMPDELWGYGARWWRAGGDTEERIEYTDLRTTPRGALEGAASILVDVLGPIDERAVDAVKRFVGTIDGLVGSDESPIDPETRFTTAEAAAQASDEAPEPGETEADRKARIKAERDFKRRLAIATEALGDAVLNLRNAERIHKAAKEQYKEASGEFERIKVRGPEHHPLFDRPARPAAPSIIRCSIGPRGPRPRAKPRRPSLGMRRPPLGTRKPGDRCCSWSWCRTACPRRWSRF